MQVSFRASAQTRRLGVLGVLTAALLVLAGAGVAFGDVDAIDGEYSTGGEQERESDQPTPPPEEGPAGGDDGPPPRGSYWARLGPRGEDGERCWDVTWMANDALEPGSGWTFDEAYERSRDNWDDDHPECPGAEILDPERPVLEIWEERAPLPDNELWIAPGEALTGMPAYLEVQGDRTLLHEVDLPAPFSMTVTFDAEAEYDVAWGDGTRSGPHASTGGPHPEGDIVHTYADAGDVEVVVTARWSGTWSVGERSGTLPMIEREHTFPLEVGELQSVRTNGR